MTTKKINSNKETEDSMTFNDLFFKEICQLLDAENQILQILPQLTKEALTPQLKKILTLQEKDTQEQIKRLQKICELIGETPLTKKCLGTAALIKEMEEIFKTMPVSELRDAALIAAAQRLKHYEIASYGTVKTFAMQLENTEAVALLKLSSEEEEGASMKLSTLAEGGFFTTGINRLAIKKNVGPGS